MITCGQMCSRCKCVKPEGHDPQDPVHVCDPSCGGSWTGTYGTDDWKVVTFPNPENLTLDAFQDRLLGALLASLSAQERTSS